MIVFYNTEIHRDTVVLTPDESKHCVKALRKKEGDIIHLTNGEGVLAEAQISVATPSQCVVQIIRREEVLPRSIRLHIAVAPTKNMDRIEWFVEKAVEIGIERISLIICDHSERTKVDIARLRRIAIAALKQSQTTLLPAIDTLTYDELLSEITNSDYAKYIAWCDHENTEQLVSEPIEAGETLILIGPEGDFSEEEIQKAKSMDFKEIKLGSRRLRTETAALYSCCAIAMKNQLLND